MDLDAQAEALLARIAAGDAKAAGPLCELYRERLWRMLAVRIDYRLSQRIAPDDVLQETFFDVSRRIHEFLAERSVSFYVWLRFLTLQRMQMQHRAHLGAGARDVGREVGPKSPAFADADSMAGQFVGHMTSPSQAAMRHELQQKLRAALDEMDPLDREVLALRHFEELSNREVAEILKLSPDAASKRHVRALQRLRSILKDHPSLAD